ncbi:MAG: hypothetical protein UFG06_14675 [Lachnospiraceae bacterium]|nr:hypothetical protein [Lachnospiraceae bacterium]
MAESEKKSRALDFYDELERFAAEKGLPLRIVDSIRESRVELQKAESPLQLEQAFLQMDSLLKHMGKKYEAEKQAAETAPVAQEEGILLQDMENRVKEILYACKTENKEMCSRYADEQTYAVKELCQNLRDILHTEAHYKEIKNMGLFTAFFAEKSDAFGRRVSQALQAFVQAMFRNCDGAMVKTKALLTKIKDERFHVGHRDFYMQYDNRYDLIKQRIGAEAAQLGSEGTGIQEFAAAQVPKLNAVVKKQERKKLLFMFLPFVVILGWMLASALIGRIGEGGQDSKTAVESETAPKGVADELIDRIGDEAVEAGKEVIDYGAEKAEGILDEFVSSTVKTVTGPVIYIIAGLIYLVYVTVIMKQSKKWLCDAAAACLTPELEHFLQETDFAGKTASKFDCLRVEMETAYGEMFTEILGKTSVSQSVQSRSEQEEFAFMRQKWKTIKQMV